MAKAPVFRGVALVLSLVGLAACAASPSPNARPNAQAAAITVTSNSNRPSANVFQGGAQISPQRMGTLESSPTGDELEFVTGLLRRMQLQSYATGAETCGYIGRDGNGRMMATRINVGDTASCWLPSVPQGMRLLASVHTHGTYDPAYASEFPTVQDMVTDAQDNIDGYISTPGGRLWYVDSDTMTVRQLCGRGCLPQDPRYRPEDDGPVRQQFTLRDLQRWENAAY